MRASNIVEVKRQPPTLLPKLCCTYFVWTILDIARPRSRSLCSLIFILIYAKMWLHPLTKDGEIPRGAGTDVLVSLCGNYFMPNNIAVSTPFLVACLDPSGLKKKNENQELEYLAVKILDSSLRVQNRQLLSLGSKMQMVEIPRILQVLIRRVSEICNTSTNL